MASNVKTLPANMIIYLLLLGVVTKAEDLVVTHAPSYVTFQEQPKPLQTSDVHKVISHTLGISTKSDLDWTGMLQGSVFKRPKANVLVTILSTDGVPELPVKKLAKFPVALDEPNVDVEYLMNTIQSSFLEHTPLMLDAALDNNVFDIKSQMDVFRKLPNTLRKMSDRLLDSDSVIQTHNTGSLNSSVTDHLQLMGELQTIQDVLNTVSDDKTMLNTKTPDLYSFTISGLRGIVGKHGSQSQEMSDAASLVTDFLDKMTQDFKNIYKDNVVVEVLTLTPQKGQIRKVRSLKADPTPDPKKATTNVRNLSPDYHEDYPVTFNIILWTMIIIFIAFYAVSYGIWNIDPGRDSIIYRMTTTRLKKE